MSVDHESPESQLKHRFFIDYLTHDHLAIMSVDVIVHMVSIMSVKRPSNGCFSECFANEKT